MPLTVVTTVDAARASVRLTVSGGVPPYVADASPGGDRSDYRVRTSWSPIAGDASARIGIDGAVPLNTPTVYVITDATGAQVASGTVTATADGPILSDATDPGVAYPVRVVAQRPNAWQARSVWWDVLGSSLPFASVAPMRARSGDLVLRMLDAQERASLIRLLRTGNPLQLRSVCPGIVDDVVALVETATEDQALSDDPRSVSVWTLAYQAISPELGPYSLDATRSYQTVVATLATYAQVLATFATYDALRTGDATAGLGPDLIANGSFTAGLASWDSFWSGGVTWDAAAGTGRATSTAANATAVLRNAGTPQAGIVVVPGERYRITGRVRAAGAAGSWVGVHAMGNTAPAQPEYFQPGVIVTALPVPAGAAWSTFTAEYTVPAGVDRFLFYLRAENLPAGAVVEWDDVTLRKRL